MQRWQHIQMAIAGQLTASGSTRHLSTAVWFKLTVPEMTINGNKSNPLIVTVTEIDVTETFS